MQRWQEDRLLTQIHDLLYRLGVKATIQGFFETSCAVYLVMRQNDASWFSIMDIYRQISELYHTDLDAIDPRIRRVIRRIWKQHPDRLNRIAGMELTSCPTPRQFINILRRYLIYRKR